MCMLAADRTSLKGDGGRGGMYSQLRVQEKLFNNSWTHWDLPFVHCSEVVHSSEVRSSFTMGKYNSGVSECVLCMEVTSIMSIIESVH